MSDTSDHEGGATPPSDQDRGGEEGGEHGETPHDVIYTNKSWYSAGDVAVVSWDIRTHPLHERDFIGLFEVEKGVDASHMTAGLGHMMSETTHITMEQLLESRLRGDTSVCSGQLQWLLSEEILPKREL